VQLDLTVGRHLVRVDLERLHLVGFGFGIGPGRGGAVGVGGRAVKPCTEETQEPPVSARARGEWTRATDMRRAGVLKCHSVRASRL
jgi:hypothetical protein